MELRTPGLYVRSLEVPPPEPFRLSIAGFVGLAERGPLNNPQVLTNWGQFRDVFGGFTGFSYLSYAVFGFFANGGRRCWVTRVAHESATRASLELRELLAEGSPAVPTPLLRLEALDVGSWGDGVEVVLTPRARGDMDLTRLEAGIGPGATSATFQSAAGLGPAGEDSVIFVHPSDPFQRHTATLTAIDYATGAVTFTPAVPTGSSFPEGATVVGKGFRLDVAFGGLRGRREVFDDLSLDPSHPRYAPRLIQGDPPADDHLARAEAGHSLLLRAFDLTMEGPGPVVPGGRPGALVTLGPPELDLGQAARLAGGDDGSPDLREAPGEDPLPYFTGYEGGALLSLPGLDPADSGRAGNRLLGLASLEAVEEIGTVLIPDLPLPDLHALVPASAVPAAGILFAELPEAGSAFFPTLRAGQQALLEHAGRVGGRMAVLDMPPGATVGRGALRAEDWAARLRPLPDSRNGALYHPWLRHRAADFEGRDLPIPPGGHLAGIFARTEEENGVGKAPANEILRGVVNLEVCLTDEEQALINPLGVNALRAFGGRGLRVWGARTLSTDPQWRYVSVRRVALAIIQQIRSNLRWTVFEPNGPALWDEIRTTLDLLMRGLFLGGALAGARPEEAFFIQVDAETNPPERVDRGELLATVGFAPALPAEFVVVTVRRTSDSLSVTEQRA